MLIVIIIFICFKNILSELIKILHEAGILIMDIYNHGFEVNHKNDNSPVTIADKKAEQFILEKLNKLFSVFQSYQRKLIQITLPNYDNEFFLVDPLDGTKEFVKKNDEFTVNIAYVEDGITQIGFINAPAKNKIFFNDEKNSI